MIGAARGSTLMGMGILGMGVRPGLMVIPCSSHSLTLNPSWILATVIDLATRMVVGWQTADHMRASLVIEALTMARMHGHVKRKAIFHSDAGSQGGFNTSIRYTDRLIETGIRASIGTVGDSYDCQSVPVGSRVDSEDLTSAA